MGAERRDGALNEALGYDISFNRSISRDAMVDVLCEQRLTLTAYLLSKVKAGDWHAVQDAASDIREIEAKLSVLRA